MIMTTPTTVSGALAANDRLSMCVSLRFNVITVNISMTGT
jgi:hypothetical protein